MILGLVRHGQTNYNRVLKIQGKMDNPLNETGREQAITTANYLLENDKEWDYLYTSPLSRAYETASIIGSKLGLEIENSLPQFIERDFGPFEGRFIKDVYPQIVLDDFRHEGYENNETIIKRIVDAAINLSHSHQDDKVLLVAHAHVVKSLCIYSDPDKYDFILNYTPNSSISYFKIENDKIELIEIITF